MVESIHESFRFKKGNQFLMLRPEFIEISQGDILGAMILRVFEVELDLTRAFYERTSAKQHVRGQTPTEPDLWTEMPWARLIRKLHLEGHITENTVKAHVRALVKRGLVLQRKHPRDPNRKPLQFLLNRAAIQAALDGMHEPLFLPDTSYLRGSKTDAQDLDPSNSEGSNPEQTLTSGPQHLTPASRSAGDQNLTPLLDTEISLEKREREAASEQNVPAEREQDVQSNEAAVAAVIAPVQQLSPDQVHHMQEALNHVSLAKPPATTEASVSQRSPSEREEGMPERTRRAEDAEETTPVEPLPPPAPDADAVVSLVESLRGRAYGPEERPRECVAARKLLTLFPHLLIRDIEAAWRHGSDDYWRRTHRGDNVHVHDLVHRTSAGVYRLEAFLLHKAAQEQHDQRSALARSSGAAHAPSVAASVPPQEASSLSHEQAEALVARIAQDAQQHGYDQLSGELQGIGSGWMVRVSWRSAWWKGDLGLQMGSLDQWQREFAEWHEVIELRMALKRKKEA